MCDPVSITLAVAFTAAGAVQDKQQADKAKKFQAAQEAAERRNAIAAQAIAAEEIQAQHIADSEAVAIEIEQNRRATASAIGTARVIAGERGAFGLSYEGLVNDFARQQAEAESASETSLALRNSMRRLNLEAGANVTDARLYNAKSLRPSSPNFGNYALQGLGTAFTIHGGLKEGGLVGKTPGAGQPNPFAGF